MSNLYKYYDVIIVGAGVSGVFAAINKDDNLKILMIDHNKEILRKFMISGKGKSNITNTSPDKIFISNLIDSNKFLYPSLTKYNGNTLLSLLDSLKINYYFKESDKVHLYDNNESVRRKFYKLLLEKGVELALGSKVLDIDLNENIFIITTTHQKFSCKSLVVATGGMSYQQLGNDGSGYQIAKSFQHTIKSLYPIGVGLHLDDKKFFKLQGISLDNVQVEVYWDNKLKYSETGSLMFTHYGIGGPVIRRVSGYVSKYLLTNNNCQIVVSFLSKKEVLDELQKHKNLSQCFKLINKKALDILLQDFDINLDLKNINKKQQEDLINSLANCSFSIKKTEDINFAINTGGGVDLKEINPNTCESLLVKNLYFIGEILDINPRTNGFNITVCFATANACIEGIIKKQYK